MTEDNEMDCIQRSRFTRWVPVNKGVVVWLTEWRTYGFLLHEGAFVSTVTLINPQTGKQIVEQVENDEFEYWEDYTIDYED